MTCFERVSPNKISKKQEKELFLLSFIKGKIIKSLELL